MRVGLGHDTHRLGPGDSLRIGGVNIPHDRRLIGHSDADVLLHAVTDAVLGAAALGDIGQLYPNTDAANCDRDSAEMLRQVYQMAQDRGFRVVNVDCIVFAERPKLAPFSGAIQQCIAEILEIPTDAVGVKSKTGEGVGPIGAEEAIAAQCVALLENAGGKRS